MVFQHTIFIAYKFKGLQDTNKLVANWMFTLITQGSLEFWSFWKECEEARDQTKRHDFRRNLDSWVQECNKMIKTLWNTNLLQLYHAALESIRVVCWMLTKNPTKLNCKIGTQTSMAAFFTAMEIFMSLVQYKITAREVAPGYGMHWFHGCWKIVQTLRGVFPFFIS